MQIFLPYKIIMTVLDEWSFHGVKSPLWFVAEGGAFMTMFVSVGSLCSLFASKCSENIRIGAEANFYILTHKEESVVILTSEEDKSPREGGNESKPLLDGGGLPKIPLPKIPESVITLNEYFWCCLSFACNVAMSFLLFFAMFLKIATYTGAISKVAIVAVALYFVFDLDGKVMDSDPKLRPKYRHAVLKQTVEKEHKPMWLLKLAATAKSVIGLLTPCGLAVIVLIAWKSDAEIIGGDSF
jgi:hypothetical protein